jgi:hypothetical protein
MATIRASCPDCGDVQLTAAGMTVRVCTDNRQGAYLFRCPRCRMVVHKPTEQRIVDLLVASGVRMETWRLPAELAERPGGAPLTHDDLLEFYETLQGEDWFATLAAMVQG